MAARPTTDDLIDDAVAFGGLPWQDYTGESATEGNMLVAFAGLPLMMIGPAGGGPPTSRRRQAMIGSF